MKNLFIKLDEDRLDIKRLEELFNMILVDSEYNLNQFVKSSDTLSVTKETSDDFSENLKEFIELFPEVVNSIEDKERFWSAFQNLDDIDNNNEFIHWLQRYVDSVTKPIEEAAFIKELDFETFKKMSAYCFKNLILQDVGKKRIDKTVGDEQQIQILRKALFTFCDMVISDNFSKENAFDNLSRMFGMEESYCEIWWKYVEQNEEKLWRILMMKHQKNLENKVESLLQIILEE